MRLGRVLALSAALMAAVVPSAASATVDRSPSVAISARRVMAGAVGTPAGAVPAGLPLRLGMGVSAEPDASGLYGWMADSGVPWDYAYTTVDTPEARGWYEDDWVTVAVEQHRPTGGGDFPSRVGGGEVDPARLIFQKAIGRHFVDSGLHFGNAHQSRHNVRSNKNCDAVTTASRGVAR